MGKLTRLEINFLTSLNLGQDIKIYSIHIFFSILNETEID